MNTQIRISILKNKRVEKKRKKTNSWDLVHHLKYMYFTTLGFNNLTLSLCPGTDHYTTHSLEIKTPTKQQMRFFCSFISIFVNQLPWKANIYSLQVNKKGNKSLFYSTRHWTKAPHIIYVLLVTDENLLSQFWVFLHL